MKFTFTLLLLFYFSINSIIKKDTDIDYQTPKIKIFSKFNNQNIVYRGIINPIVIKIENNLSYTASGDGLKKIDDLGNYKLSPQTGKEIIITVTGKSFSFSKTFKIKDIGIGTSQINGKSCKKCEIRLSRKELSNGKVSYAFPDLLIDGLKTEVVSFSLKIPGKPTKKIKGNRIKSSLLIKDILKIKRGTLVQIFDIQIKSNLTARICKTVPMQIRIIG
ncbi:GldM family protein [Olleya sp. R77988]|uniref:GldM family protein n=1 Tax=Olleya sp. R77988 TaxID=3093875 RepID=UPI0037CA7B28